MEENSSWIDERTRELIHLHNQQGPYGLLFCQTAEHLAEHTDKPGTLAWVSDCGEGSHFFIKTEDGWEQLDPKLMKGADKA
jgi:hypothetical protein